MVEVANRQLFRLSVSVYYFCFVLHAPLKNAGKVLSVVHIFWLFFCFTDIFLLTIDVSSLRGWFYILQDNNDLIVYGETLESLLSRFELHKATGESIGVSQFLQ